LEDIQVVTWAAEAGMEWVLDEIDLYEVLQIAEDASIEEVKTAYRRLALENHPDRVDDPQATERMQRINAAYGTLGDPAKRAEYDLERAARFREALDSLDSDPIEVEEDPERTQEIRISKEEMDNRRHWAKSQLKVIFRILLFTSALFAWTLITGQVNFAVLVLLLVIALQVILSIMMRVRNVSAPGGASNE
jgi:DnaJ-domain-containing protein 1